MPAQGRWIRLGVAPAMLAVLALVSVSGAQTEGRRSGARERRGTSSEAGQRARSARPRAERGQRDRRESGVVPAYYPAPIDKRDESVDARVRSRGKTLADAISESNPDEHPLMPAVRWAKSQFDEIKQLEDYSCTLVKRERVDGELMEHEYMYVKVRHEPFSIYTYFLKPSKKKGREAIYVDGQNDGKLWAHTTGFGAKAIGTISLLPTSSIAMRDNRYPITELGLRRLTERLIEVGEQDSQYGECEVKLIDNAKVNKRDCTCIQVLHPVPRKNFLFHMARIYVDNELNLPTRYEAYDWPEEEGGEPVLYEEYTYLDLKINNGFTDEDFDTKNADYAFP